MIGYNVIFYILIDDVVRLFRIELGFFRIFKLLVVFKDKEWKDFNFIYMKNLYMYVIEYI